MGVSLSVKLSNPSLLSSTEKSLDLPSLTLLKFPLAFGSLWLLQLVPLNKPVPRLAGSTLRMFPLTSQVYCVRPTFQETSDSTLLVSSPKTQKNFSSCKPRNFKTAVLLCLQPLVSWPKNLLTERELLSTSLHNYYPRVRLGKELLLSVEL